MFIIKGVVIYPPPQYGVAMIFGDHVSMTLRAGQLKLILPTRNVKEPKGDYVFRCSRISFLTRSSIYTYKASGVSKTLCGICIPVATVSSFRDSPPPV
jgi:hypothetical protein